MNLSTLIILIIVLALAALAVRSIVKMHKSKGCCMNCSGCAHASGCTHAGKKKA